MRKQIYLFVWIGILSSSLSISAQTTNPVINSTLTGRILDAQSGESLAGTTVVIKGTTHGVTSDGNGNFSIRSGQKLPYTLTVSYVGYYSRDVSAEGNSVEVKLAPNPSQLGEVVVVGYGTQRKADLTGSVASVSSDIIKQTPVSSFDKLLQDSVAGVQVIQTSGQPGSAVSIRIRGGNSITGGNEPLLRTFQGRDNLHGQPHLFAGSQCRRGQYIAAVATHGSHL